MQVHYYRPYAYGHVLYSCTCLPRSEVGINILAVQYAPPLSSPLVLIPTYMKVGTRLKSDLRNYIYSYSLGV